MKRKLNQFQYDALRRLANGGELTRDPQAVNYRIWWSEFGEPLDDEDDEKTIISRSMGVSPKILHWLRQNKYIVATEYDHTLGEHEYGISDAGRARLAEDEAQS